MAVKLNQHDLEFILKQIKIAESHVAGTPLTQLIDQPHLPYGLRTVDGSDNNLIPGRETWGASDQLMPRLLDPSYRQETDNESVDINGSGPGGVVSNNDYGTPGHVADSDPRTITNLISDQTLKNPAAIIAALQFAEFNGDLLAATNAIRGAYQAYLNAAGSAAAAAIVGITDPAQKKAAFETAIEPLRTALYDGLAADYGFEMDGNSIVLPNVAPDEGLSAPFNAWMTFFGQFFDHGLDLIHKGNNGTIFVPLAADDPLRTHGPDGIAGSGDEVPPYFTDDLFQFVGEHRRPPYRWFLVGPARSGTTVHVDPLSTSAWNTLVYGRKRWVLFPPHFTKEFVKGRKHIRKAAGEDDESIDYFNNILPRIKEEGGPAVVSQIIEVTQRAGDTIFVPANWWHAVLNLDDTIAVTQNFCSTTNFAGVWEAVRAGRRGLARKWLRMLRTDRPDLAAIADRLNAAAGWDIDAEAARHAARVAAAAAARAARAAARAARGSDADSSDESDSSRGSSSSGSVTSDSDSDAPPKASAARGGGGGCAGCGCSDEEAVEGAAAAAPPRGHKRAKVGSGSGGT